jgi:intracellular septation protein
MHRWLVAHPLFTKRVLSKLLVGSILDFSPPLVFIIAFELSDFFVATAWFMAATVLMSSVAFFIEKRVPYFSLYISLVTLFFGWWTLFFHDPHYIQIRDTFYDLVLALTLLYGYSKGKLLFKSAFSHSIKIADSSWERITQAWIIFFLLGASLNEVARRVFNEEYWLYFKLSFLVLTIMFGMWVLFYFYKPVEEKE